MTARQQSHEQRKAYRCPVTRARQKAVLQIQGTEYPARVMNESAGGFAIRLCQKPGCQPEDVALLRTDSGESQVQVTYLHEDRLSIVQSARQQVGAEWVWLIGLRRLEDLACPPDLPGVNPWVALPRIVLQAIPRLSTLVVGITVASLCVVIPLAAFALAGKLDRKTLRRAGVLGDRPIAWSSEASASRAARSPSSSLGVPRTERAGPERDPAPPAFSSPRWRTRPSPLRRRIRQAAGPAGLLLPEIIARLSLTDRQQSQIRRVLQSTGLFHEVSGSWQWVAEPPPEAALEIERVVRAILTDQQRALWDTLRGPVPATVRPAPPTPGPPTYGSSQ